MVMRLFGCILHSALLLGFVSSGAAQAKGHLELNANVTSTEVAALGQDSCSGCTEALSQAYQACVVKHGNPCAETNKTGLGGAVRVKKDIDCCTKKEKHNNCLKCSSLKCTKKTCKVNKQYYNLRAITERVEEAKAKTNADSIDAQQEPAIQSKGLPTRMLNKSGPLKSTPLSLLSLNLDKWGAKATSHTSELPLDDMFKQATDLVMNPLAQVLPSESNLYDPRGFESHSLSLFAEPKHGNGIRNFAIVVFIVLVLALLLSCLCCDASPSEEEEHPHSPDKEVQQDFATVEFSDGSWAQVYREARGEQKEALELLFRCNIISTDEFAFSSVSQEHIQECIWIATHMLRQKPLEEWVALWQQAQQTFEDSVTACFEARGGPHSPGYNTSPAMMVPALSLGAVPLAGRSNRLSPSIGEDEDEDDPYTTRSHYTPNPGLRIPDSQNSQNTVDSDQTRWSIESELDKGLAAHGLR